jgi:5-methylcytosine-specific restriction endonuclease McrA
MVIVEARHLCLYCGEPTNKGRKGEHIVPEAIGGALTLNDVSSRVVCQKCNSGVLSVLDKELCSRSYLSAIASQVIDAHLWQV